MSGAVKLFKVGLVSGQANCSQVFEEPEDCFEVGVGYNYGDYLDYFTADDPISCQARCQKYNGCSHFSFYTSNSECYMKTGDSDKRDNSEVVSGPRSCSQDTVSTTQGPQAGKHILKESQQGQISKIRRGRNAPFIFILYV